MDAWGQKHRVSHWSGRILFPASTRCEIILFLLLMLSCLTACPAYAASNELVWTGGSCCGQNQPQFIHDPQALVDYFRSTPLPLNSPFARTFPSYTTCLAPPTSIGQSCYVYAWYTNIDYASEAKSECPVDPLPELPKDDLCAQSLEKGRGVDVDGKCPQPSDKLTPNGQIQCFANKIAATNAIARPQISYTNPSAIVRNPACQKHLLDIWNKMIELNKLADPDEIKACQPLRDKVAAEKGCYSSKSCGGVFSANSHAIDYEPADYSNHSTGTAFDVPRNTINGLLTELTPLPPAPMTSQQRLQFRRSVVAAWLATPTACSLTWGGSFQDPDYVHFQLP